MEFQTDRLKFFALGLFLIQVSVLIALQWFFAQDFSVLAAIFTLLDASFVVYLIFQYEKEKKERVISISRVLGTETKDVLIYGQIGVIIYDDDYIATWCSELFVERGIELIGERITRSIPGSEVLLNGDSDKAIFTIGEREYEFSRSENGRVLFVKDVTELNELETIYNDEKIVLGLIHLDNYEETIQYEDEQKIANINTNIRQKVIEWAKGYGSIIRRIRGDRFLVVLNEKEFREMLKDRFSILDSIKKEANDLNVAISCSIAFARGTSDNTELDNMINDLLELVLSRGGDQVAVKAYGEEVQFYGTSSEASEKKSKVQVRVIAQTLKGIINESDNVFVVPHKDADFDAFGACLGISRFVQAFNKNAFIVSKDISIEESARDVINENLESIEQRHAIISEEDAIEFSTKKSLVIVCDHHSLDLTAAPDLVKKNKRIIILDHHRRKQETTIEAMLIYNEPSASSTVELVAELIEYQPARVELDTFEATFMYAGLLVDTDGFRSRCSSRSFEVCAYLRREGADISLANDWLKESLQQFEIKNKLLKYSEIINGNIMLAVLPEKEGMISRSMISQVANSVLQIKDIDASFVIAKTEEDICSISGRSNAEVNVQLILEQLGGGGHFTAAGVQQKGAATAELRKKLLEAINEYLEGAETDEGNTAE